MWWSSQLGHETSLQNPDLVFISKEAPLVDGFVVLGIIVWQDTCADLELLISYIISSKA